MVLLNCPNLEMLEYRFAVVALDKAIESVGGSVREVKNDGQLSLLCVDKTVSSVTNHLPHRTFRLKNLDFNSDNGATVMRSFFESVGKYCPLLEDLTLTSAEFNEGDLNGLLSLPLRSMTISDTRTDTERPICLEVLRLLQSVGSCLTTLTLDQLFMFDLRVLSHECPNLTALNMSDCNIAEPYAATWSNYRLNPCQTAVFNSLTKLVLRGSFISQTHFVALLSSPNLETLEFSDYSERTMLLAPVFRQLFLHCTEAFSKLQSLSFEEVKLNESTLTEIVLRASVLDHLKLFDCCVPTLGEDFFEGDSLSRLINEINPGLQYEWRREWSSESEESGAESDEDFNGALERAVSLMLNNCNEESSADSSNENIDEYDEESGESENEYLEDESEVVEEANLRDNAKETSLLLANRVINDSSLLVDDVVEDGIFWIDESGQSVL